MSKMEKFKNRLISIACLAVFAVGISLLTIMTVKLIENYNEQQALLAERDKLLEEKENQNKLDTLTKEFEKEKTTIPTANELIQTTNERQRKRK